MAEIIGDFQSDGAAVQEGLELTFSASSIPLKQRWRNNGLSADFLADYVTTFIPRDEDDPASHARHDEIRGAVAYIANELLENAMKYSAEIPGQPIHIKMVLEPDSILFAETNATAAEHGRSFQAFVTEMATADIGELYVRQLERASEGKGSGLGLITMVSDYGARLSWKFEDLGAGTMRVTTQVRLEI